ncbi:MAG: RNA polymerase factor sigma-54 [Pseudomonadota bacterium]|nr:RNA polymerase factor sigma-54 [Pseudomonadota bacterium]
MKPSLQLRLSQHLALTPQLQQSIRLLQLSTLELHQEVGQMLDENPFLETDEESALTAFETPPERQATDKPASAEGADNLDSSEGAEATTEIRAEDFGTTEREDWENGTEQEDFDGIRETPSSASGSAPGAEGDDGDPNERNASVGTLADHLRSQVPGMRLSDDDRAALLVLIDSLDIDGYLADELEEIALRLAEMLALDSEEAQEQLRDQLRCALRWLQSLEPTGVGASSLSECLALQLEATPACATRALALRISEQHLELLARRDIKRLMAATGADEDAIRDAQNLIRTCEPKPGRAFAPDENNIVVPDVVVRKTGRGMSVTLNPDVMPKLRINDLYAQAVKGGRGGGGSPGMSSRLQEARWFVKNIQQRFDTILRVSKAIVERQKAFFTHGAIAMKPLVLREIAEELQLHESTISRVTTAKYMATPQGTFELKYFFGSSLNTETGGNASSTAVRALIQQLVSAEDGGKPLSDNQLSDMLEEQGIQVARRTVAKYREALKIAPASQRKAI